MEDRKPNKVVGENIPRIHGDCAEIEDSVVDPSIDGGHDVSGWIRWDNEFIFRWQNETKFCDKFACFGNFVCQR